MKMEKYEILSKGRLITGLLLILFGMWGCSKLDKNDSNASATKDQKRPNILWLVTEDMGQYIPPFGDSTIQTPNLSRLAAEGIRFTNLYSTSGVCAPSRAAIATGMYPSGIGANHMRTNSYTEERGMPPYEAVPPADVRMISELLRAEGYYCTNNYKTDYQFKAPMTAWDENSPYAHWRNRDKGQPFFAVFNFTDTHESGLFEPYGFRNIETRHYHAGDTSYHWGKDRMSEEETPVHLSKDTNFNIPPYLPDNEVVRRDMWKMYNNIAEMDSQLGAVLAQLEEDGLLDETIIFFYGDHGGPLPRQKRLIYDSGLKTPLIVRYPNQEMNGTIDDQLVSFIDFAPSLLSLVGKEIPDYMDGQAFLGNQASEPREYIHAAADRFDEVTDVIRAVKDQRFKYIRNYRPQQGYYLPLNYREQIPTMQELLRLRDLGQLNDVQTQWFRDQKPEEELFDCIADPHELNNLADDPKYEETLQELSMEMDRWLNEIEDDPELSERDLLTKLWNGNQAMPVTSTPEIKMKADTVEITSATEGASIGYMVVDSPGVELSSWTVYTEPFTITKGQVVLTAKAHRIGYQPSQQETLIWNETE
ncbi:sulfatase-like hydrolase/transferase [Reichenbachiella ulvae]|uniref:Sulfatase-like hydrolase/transferase n=1 Tax=Reichenbachiella ulvae TaxID=2980104 RepID=A0ABT3CSF1_9BACT|nr:sulfatase-like hydrolase/transferase [Reichenbachiella ulvae]MCV9386636.1 sulfatase-like hydrolase/transferase [Reichenbachiella ulvae]